jgi:hypothetical protein
MGKCIARRRWEIFGWAVMLALLVLAGCEEEATVRPDINREPETTLAVAPELGSEVFHKYHVNWVGHDRDGVVVRYRIATMPEEELYNGITDPDDKEAYLFDILFDPDNPGGTWFETEATESLFVFSADSPNSKKHSLYISAIDNEGKLDPTPAATNFMAIDFGLPQIKMLFASNIDTVYKVPPAKGVTLPAYNGGDIVEARIKWEGVDPANPDKIDPDGVVTEWLYRLDSSAERRLDPDMREVSFVYNPDSALVSDVWIGFHEFKLVGVDDANARSDDYVVRFTVNYDPDTYIDSVWTFRDSKLDSVGEELIYPSDGTPKRVWDFGRLRFKFHGYDQDKFPGTEISPAYFTWRIKGTLIASNPTWVSKMTGEFIDGQPVFADTLQGPQSSGDESNVLDTDSPVELILRARDELGTIDGTPATITLIVNYSPEIESIDSEPTGPGSVMFTWQSDDPDEDYGWGSGGKDALMRYRYRIDSGPWVVFGDSKLGPDHHYVKFVEVTGLEPGTYKFTLEAYNAQYFTTRSDQKSIQFTVD